jgi:hypothetical protein
MAIDFTHPIATDTESAVLAYVRDNITAQALMLDSVQTTITGTPPTYAKRFEATTTAFQEWSGTAWANRKFNGWLMDGAGNLSATGGISLGGTAPVWASAAKALDFTFTATGMDSAGRAFINFNAYESAAGVWRYKSTDEAGLYTVNTDGSHSWATAPSGAINTTITFTDRMYLSPAGLAVTGTLSASGAGINSIQSNLTGAGNGFSLRATSGDGTVLSTRMYGLELNWSVNRNSYVDFYRGGAGNDGHLRLGASGADVATISSAGLAVTGTLSATGGFTGNAATATNVAYSGLTGTVPTWNQNTTGNAATATNVQAGATDGTYELGYKGLPPASVTTGAFAASDRGKCVYATAGVTVPDATMAANDVVTIINTTAGAITITATVTTLRQIGTGLTGNRTLGAYGIASVVFASGTSAYINGTGLT